MPKKVEHPWGGEELDEFDHANSVMSHGGFFFILGRDSIINPTLKRPN